MSPLRDAWLRHQARRIGGATMEIAMPDGWYPIGRFLAGSMDRMVRRAQAPRLAIEDLTERHAGMIVHLSDPCGTDPDHPICEAIQWAEVESRTTCMVCGANGQPIFRRGWAHVLCAEHTDEREAANATARIAARDAAEAEAMIRRGADQALVEALERHRAWMRSLVESAA